MSGTESFIPLRRRDVLELCAAESGEADGFRGFGELLLALLHHRSLGTLEALKDAYAAFNPDRDTVCLEPQADREALAAGLRRQLDETLRFANYRPLGGADLERALGEASIIPLNTRVDLEDYCDYAFYYRGSRRQALDIRRHFRSRRVQVENLERVVVLLRFGDPARLARRSRKWRMQELDFQPGRIYLYLYKNVPRNDLELLFPNVEVSMTWRDKLLFVVPAAAGAGPLLIKVLPALGLIFGLMVVLTAGPEMARQWNLDTGKGQALYPVLVAVMSASFALGGFAVKQYLNYKNKKLKFQKRVTDTLFFKNLVSNRGVLFTVIDSAEEELGKEMLLAYHLLRRADAPLDRAELDRRVEQWIAGHCERRVDFDVHKALEALLEFRHDGRAIVTERDGCWSALPLAAAKTVLDRYWDARFDYAAPDSAAVRPGQVLA